MFVTKDTEVFQASAGVTAGRCCGLNGRNPCSRKIAYVTPSATAENTISETP